MAWWVWLIIYVASFFIQRALAPKPDKPQPKGLSDFTLPTADSSRALPVVFGTCRITGPNVIWYGNFAAQGYQIEDQDAGFDYYLGMALGLCMGPLDDISNLCVDEKGVGLTLEHTWADGHRTYSAWAFELFGGHKPGGSGGIGGYVDVYFGTGTQDTSPYLTEKANADWPALRKVAYAVFRDGVYFLPYNTPLHCGFYVGCSEYIRPIALTVHRYPNSLGLTGERHHISVAGDGTTDANPACMLYEILTDSVWGLGLPAAAIDVDSFRAAGETLHAESFGLSMVFDQQSEASELIAEILRHVDGDLCVDPQTGLIAFALTRADYDPDTLPVLDPSCLQEVEFTRGSWSETANVAKVTYTSARDGFTDRVAQVQNQANLQVRGQVAVSEVPFRGISNARVANLVASRVVRALSYPFARLKLKANRAAWALRPGSVFKLEWPALGISGMVCRVTRPAYGELTDGRMTIEAIEDSFSLAGTVYSDPAPSGWTDPIGDPAPASAQALLEAPHRFSGGELRTVLALAARADESQLGFQVWADPAGGTAFEYTNSDNPFVPVAELEEEMPASRPAIDDAEWVLAGAQDLFTLASVTEAEFLAGVNLLLIDEEIIGWRCLTNPDGAWRISRFMRGVLDTVPAFHTAGAKVWFLPRRLPLVNPAAPYQSDLTVAAKALPYNSRHTLPIVSATVMTLTTASRAWKPFPPGRIRINDQAYPADPWVVSGDAVVTWNHRHRTVQTAAGVLVSQDADDVAAAPEGTYTIQVRIGGVLRRTVTGLTSKTWTWTTAMQSTDGATSGSTCAIRIIPVNGSLSGTFQEREFQLA